MKFFPLLALNSNQTCLRPMNIFKILILISLLLYFCLGQRNLGINQYPIHLQPTSTSIPSTTAEMPEYLHKTVGSSSATKPRTDNSIKTQKDHKLIPQLREGSFPLQVTHLVKDEFKTISNFFKHFGTKLSRFLEEKFWEPLKNSKSKRGNVPSTSTTPPSLMEQFFFDEDYWSQWILQGLPLGIDCNLKETTNNFELSASIPGVSKDKLKVHVSGDIITISGEVTNEKEKEGEKYHLSERSFGVFERNFRMPKPVDMDNIKAYYDQGILTLTVPKVTHHFQEPRLVQIDIKNM